jgi:hypothetical protein
MKVVIKGSSTSVAGGNFAVVNAETGEQIAAVKAIETRCSRNAANSYDRHRISKGDMFDSTVEYVVEGDIEAACKSIANNLPQAFKDARFGTSWFKQDATDFYACFNFLRTICACGGWYGNTPAPVVKKIKTAWKKGFALEI